MKTDATQKTLKALRDNGWSACVVERYLAFAKVRVDAFGFGDILAMRPATYGTCTLCLGTGRAWKTKYRKPGKCSRCDGRKETVVGEQAIALVQCCPGASHAAHKKKILGIPEFYLWKKAGGRVFLVSWARRGARGWRHWAMREEEL